MEQVVLAVVLYNLIEGLLKIWTPPEGRRVQFSFGGDIDLV
jgi:hypothetical protein